MSYAVLLTSAAPGEAASAPYRVTLADPVGDDRGPGGYVPPSAGFYGPNTFDLRAFEVRLEGDDVVFEVTLGEIFREPHHVRRTDAQQIRFENGIYLQNVDIYIDVDGSPLTGTTEAIPGRNVTLDPASPWDKAVLITPQPALARALMDGWRYAESVITPHGVRSRGPVLTARVPVALLGIPNKRWGFSVMISGALWQASLDAVGRLIGEHRQNILTMPVLTVAEALAFGGAQLHGLDPWVLDILTPGGAGQRRILSGVDPKQKALAKVPMVYPFPEGRASVKADLPKLPTLSAPRAPPPGTNEGDVVLRVKDVQKDMVVLARGEAEVKQFTLGAVLDSEGQPVAQLVVTAVYPKFILATAVEGADAIVVGAAVRFESSKKERD